MGGGNRFRAKPFSYLDRKSAKCVAQKGFCHLLGESQIWEVLAHSRKQNVLSKSVILLARCVF